MESSIEYYNSFTKKHELLHGQPVFIRFGRPQVSNGEYIPSSINRMGEKIGDELGISVYDGIYDPKSGFYAIQGMGSSGNLGLSIAINQKRPAYLVSGNVVGEGSDGEPLLNPKTFKIIKEIPYNKILSTLDRGNLSNDNLVGLENMYPIHETRNLIKKMLSESLNEIFDLTHLKKKSH